MKELDFSGISTEQLKRVTQDYIMDRLNVCKGISCNTCPLDSEFCDGFNLKHHIKINKLFKEELKRREDKEMNNMPELKSGQLASINGKDFFILLPHINKNKGLQAYMRDGSESSCFYNQDIIMIKEIKDGYHYGVFFNDRIREDNTNIVWSKKSDTDIKIEELSETIKKATEQIEELRKGIK